MYRVSVVMTIYNNEATLRSAIDPIFGTVNI